jgi:predicted phage-related endonuclease
MEWGIEQEQFAVMEYEASQNVLTDKTGFWLHPEVSWLGVSPDRLVGDEGLIEVKCPNTTTHLGYLFEGKIPTDYYKQIQCQLWVTGRQWCDFVSYDPRLPKRNQLLIVRTERDASLIAEMEAETIKFLGEINQLIIKLEG